MKATSSVYQRTPQAGESFLESSVASTRVPPATTAVLVFFLLRPTKAHQKGILQGLELCAAMGPLKFATV